MVMQRFFEKRFASVALAGRVPVSVDATFGRISPGDCLTSSPMPGVAMRATQPGPIIGTALEGLEQGRGQILMFVHRGWYGGEGVNITDTRFKQPSRDETREIAALRARLCQLEKRIERLAPERTIRSAARLGPE